MEVVEVEKDKEAVASEDFAHLLHPYNTTLVTTKNKDGKANVLAVAWIIPVSASPPYLAMSIRPQRHSYQLLMENPEFIVNIPTYDLATQIVLCGRHSGKDHDKLQETGLTPERAKMVSAPIIKQCIAHIECKLERTIETGDHILCIGRVIAAYASKKHFNKGYDPIQHKPALHLRGNIFTTTIDNAEDLTQTLQKQ